MCPALCRTPRLAGSKSGFAPEPKYEPRHQLSRYAVALAGFLRILHLGLRTWSQRKPVEHDTSSFCCMTHAGSFIQSNRHRSHKMHRCLDGCTTLRNIGFKQSMSCPNPFHDFTDKATTAHKYWHQRAGLSNSALLADRSHM